MVDVGADLGSKSAADITIPIPHLVSEEKYNNLIVSLMKNRDD